MEESVSWKVSSSATRSGFVLRLLCNSKRLSAQRFTFFVGAFDGVNEGFLVGSDDISLGSGVGLSLG